MAARNPGSEVDPAIQEAVDTHSNNTNLLADGKNTAAVAESPPNKHRASRPLPGLLKELLVFVAFVVMSFFAMGVGTRHQGTRMSHVRAGSHLPFRGDEWRKIPPVSSTLHQMPQQQQQQKKEQRRKKKKEAGSHGKQ